MSVNDSEPKKPSRYSLATLMAIVAIAGVTLAVCRWNMSMGGLLFMTTAGLAGVFLGKRNRRPLVTLCGVLLLGAAMFVLIRSATVIAWVGRRSLDVRVMVLESEQLVPIENAVVEVLDGPHSPLEGPIQSVDTDFSHGQHATAPGELTTNERGIAMFSHEFHAAGSDGLFTNSGYISTKNVWVRVTADGYRTTLMPVDGQSIRPRDISDTSPVCVTVPMGRQE